MKPCGCAVWNGAVRPDRAFEALWANGAQALAQRGLA